MGPGLWGRWGLGGDLRYKGMERRGMRDWGNGDTGDWKAKGMGAGRGDTWGQGTLHWGSIVCLAGGDGGWTGRGNPGTGHMGTTNDRGHMGVWHMGTRPPQPTAAVTRSPCRPGTPSFPSPACNELDGLSLGLGGIPGVPSALGGTVSAPLPPMQVPGEVPSGAVRAGLPGEL